MSLSFFVIAVALTSMTAAGGEDYSWQTTGWGERWARWLSFAVLPILAVASGIVAIRHPEAMIGVFG